ncbi:exopolysaccharide transport family protein [Flavobacterium aquicola]|uniref:non-specific protein-tyrosine kinase n=1 Tax=Flavobacterium aquicola TaxID=1682742 RepID=A0A3E0EUQ2_9FLAO|nr:tyrosine-protein kinase family protein [Flavobacterium aquicola]REH01906.1 capsular exopolysaccharide synthesis family protein [Flavobacterium aquicola]
MDFKKEFLKYFKYWPWFAVSLILFGGGAYYYIGAVSPSYETSALINIDTKKPKDAEIIGTNNVKKDKEEDLEEEKMFITSNDFLSTIITDLKLNINYYEKGYLDNKVSYDIPFEVKSLVSNDSLPQMAYNVKIVEQGFIVNEVSTEKRYMIRNHTSSRVFKNIPFTIELTSKAKKNILNYLDKEYVVTLEPTGIALKNLKAALNVVSYDSPNTNLLLSHIGNNPALSVKILDKLIESLDKDIVDNKQKKFTKTISYLNQRIAVFTKEKDSIESIKENYLSNNNIYVLDQYIAAKTTEKTTTTANSLLNEKQIALTRFAIDDIRKSGSTSVLGTDYNLDLPSVSSMLANYNTRLMESEVLLQRAQKNNPTYLSLMEQLKIQKQTILNTLGDYLNHLNQTNVVNKLEQDNAVTEAKSIPTKDKELGNINNNLSLKEETYLALLQRREEAILNGAVLESNLSILDSPQTNYSAIFPKPKPFMLGAILFGFLLPLGFIYLTLQMDSKIHNEEDIQGKLDDIPFLGTIPKIHVSKKLENSATSRSIIAEATCTLFSNISYLLPHKEDKKGNILLFCSSIQGEGKSFCAYHNAITISNLNRKVLLIGADLRNPQLHDYFNVEKSTLGLSNFLSNKNEDWKSFVVKEPNSSENLDILFSGKIPPNPTQLLTNSNFEILLEEAKNLYDFIIIDTAPVQVVSDTLNFSSLADVTLYIVKSNYSDKRSLSQLKNFVKKGQLKNVGIVINGINEKNAYGYGYTYSYKEEKKEKKSWFKIA